MQYRRLDSNGDYTFGKGPANLIANTPATVGQAVLTRLRLIKGEWFLDVTDGTPYNSQILGAGMVATYDAAIQDVILNTQGVVNISAYSSQVNPATRQATVSATINTIYGQTTIQTDI